jgi:hypothetical protein
VTSLTEALTQIRKNGMTAAQWPARRARTLTTVRELESGRWAINGMTGREWTVQTADVASGRSSADALAQVLHGVITGEGPTTLGRIHYSRCIDAQDTALIRRILLAGGERPIGRTEADLLFDIHEAALDQADGGAFADLFVRAIAHHVLVDAGLPLPSRARALERPVSSWAESAAALPAETAAWLRGRLQRQRRPGSLAALAVSLGLAPHPPRSRRWWIWPRRNVETR